MERFYGWQNAAFSLDMNMEAFEVVGQQEDESEEDDSKNSQPFEKGEYFLQKRVCHKNVVIRFRRDNYGTAACSVSFSTIGRKEIHQRADTAFREKPYF